MTWSKKSLVEIANLSLGKILDEKKNRGNSHPYLANINVRWGVFDLENLREMRFEPNEMERYGLKYGDIVMCEGGEPGRCAIWKEALPGMMLQKALHRIRPHRCIDHRFLYYSFLFKGNMGGFESLLTGSTIKHLPLQNLAKLEIAVPQYAVQQRVADILSTYDDLIEVNRRRIAVLEEMARRLFDEWFVHFRFPGHESHRMVEREHGVLPEGWSRQTLTELADDVSYGFTASANRNIDGPRFLRITDIVDGPIN